MSGQKNIDGLVAALKQIRGLKSEPIGNSGFSVGPLALFQASQRIAGKALKEHRKVSKEASPPTPAGGLGEAEREAVLKVLEPFARLIDDYESAGLNEADHRPAMGRVLRSRSETDRSDPPVLTWRDLRAARALFQNLSQEGE